MSSRAPLLAVLVVLSFFAGITGVQLAYTLAYVLLLLLVVAWVWSQILARRLEVHRQTPEGAHMVGEAFTERFTLRNRSVLTLPYCEVHDRTRMPGYTPGRACALNPGDVPHGRGLDVPPDISSVRDHSPDDGLSRIHWPSTARAGRLISRLYESQQSSDVMVILDLGRSIHFGEAPESTLEYAVSLTASICHAALARGQAVGLVTNDRVGTAIGPGRGATQRLRILEFLATAQDQGRRGIAATIAAHGRGWQGRGGLIVVTSDREPDWVEALVEVGARGQRHLAVMVDPTSFGASGPPMRVGPAWRLALDWWIVRRGDALSAPRRSRAVGM